MLRNIKEECKVGDHILLEDPFNYGRDYNSFLFGINKGNKNRILFFEKRIIDNNILTFEILKRITKTFWLKKYVKTKPEGLLLNKCYFHRVSINMSATRKKDLIR